MRAWVAAFATLLLVGSVTTALVETFAGGSAKSILGPNTLGVVDPRSDRVVAGIAVGDTPTAVAVGGGAVWVLNANEQTLSRIDPRSRKVLKTIPAGPAPSDIAVGAGAVWVASAGFTLTEIDPDSGSVLRTLKLPMTPRLLGRDANSAWVAARNDRVWAAGLGSVMRVAPPGPRLLLRTVRCCGGIAIGDGSVWVTDDAGLARLDAKTGAISAQIRLPFSASRLAVGAGAVWVVDPNGNAVWTIDPRLNQVTRTITVGSNPQGVAVGQGGVWIASADGTIARIDSATQRVVETVLVEGTPAGLAVGAGAVWVSLD